MVFSSFNKTYTKKYTFQSLDLESIFVVMLWEIKYFSCLRVTEQLFWRTAADRLDYSRLHTILSVHHNEFLISPSLYRAIMMMVADAFASAHSIKKADRSCNEDCLSCVALLEQVILHVTDATGQWFLSKVSCCIRCTTWSHCRAHLPVEEWLPILWCCKLCFYRTMQRN